MSSALALEARVKVTNFLKSWIDSGQLTYKFSVHENPLQPTRVRATFSKPTPESPATAAVAHLHFQLDDRLKQVLGFTIESETHFHSTTELRFDETLLDHVIRRKLVLKQQHLIPLSDEFSSTRVPALMKELEDEKRDHSREALEEYLLERFQRKDPYNDGRISFQECRDVLYALEFPTISRRERDILFSFIELDRDEMVDYGALISIGAEVIDTLLHAPGIQNTGAKATESEPSDDNQDDAIEWFHAVVKHQQLFTAERLKKILDAYRPPPPTPPTVAESKVTDGDHDPDAKEETVSVAEEKGSELKEISESKSQLVLSALPELYVTRRQLRTSLESPQLVLSRAEINLIVALAVAAPSGQIPCSQLSELLQHVQTMVFRFQSRCFTDRIEHYLLAQFRSYESSKLQGSATHLKNRLRQKEVKAVVKDMKKLLLLPFQVARIVVLCEGSPTDGDHVIHYKEVIPKIAGYLAQEVNVQQLRVRAAACIALNHGSSPSLLPDEELLRQVATEKLEALDEARTGAVSTVAFRGALHELIESLGVAGLDNERDTGAITALADPMGHGRVNYVHFQQLLFPLLRFFEYEELRVQQQVMERSGDVVPDTNAGSKKNPEEEKESKDDEKDEK